VFMLTPLLKSKLVKGGYRIDEPPARSSGGTYDIDEQSLVTDTVPITFFLACDSLGGSGVTLDSVFASLTLDFIVEFYTPKQVSVDTLVALSGGFNISVVHSSALGTFSPGLKSRGPWVAQQVDSGTFRMIYVGYDQATFSFQTSITYLAAQTPDIGDSITFEDKSGGDLTPTIIDTFTGTSSDTTRKTFTSEGTITLNRGDRITFAPGTYTGVYSIDVTMIGTALSSLY
jgi:hypothetical protein